MTNPLDLAASLRRGGSKTYTITGNVNTGDAEKISKSTGGTGGDFTVIATRNTATVSTISSVAADGQLQFNSIINGKAVRLYSIETNVPMRVRIYTDSISATADASRTVGIDPVTNSGCLFEFVTTSNLLISKLSPLVDIFSDNIVKEDFTFILSNLSATSSILEVTFTYIMQEI